MSKYPDSCTVCCECGVDTSGLGYKAGIRLAQNHADKTGHLVTFEVSYIVHPNKEQSDE